MAYEPEWLHTTLSGSRPSRGLFTTSTKLYWATLTFLGKIDRANIVTGEEVTAPYESSPQVMVGNGQSMCSDGEYLYWLTRNPTIDFSETAIYYITRMSLATGVVEAQWRALGVHGGIWASLAVDNEYLYLGSSKNIGRLKKSAGAVLDPEWITALEAGESFGEEAPGMCLCVDATHIYWSYGEGIGRAKLSEHTVTQGRWYKSVQLRSIRSMVIDSEHIWLATGGAEEQLLRARIDGTSLSKIGVVPLDSLPLVAVDATYLYWTSGHETIGRWNLSELPAEETITEENQKEKEKAEKEKEEEEPGGGEGEEKGETQKEREEKEKVRKEQEKEREETGESEGAEKEKAEKERGEKEKREEEEVIEGEEERAKEEREGTEPKVGAPASGVVAYGKR